MAVAVLLWGGYGVGWSWIGFGANDSLWGWLHLLLLVAVAALPLWLAQPGVLHPRRRRVVELAAAAFVLEEVGGYPLSVVDAGAPPVRPGRRPAVAQLRRQERQRGAMVRAHPRGRQPPAPAEARSGQVRGMTARVRLMTASATLERPRAPLRLNTLRSGACAGGRGYVPRLGNPSRH